MLLGEDFIAVGIGVLFVWLLDDLLDDLLEVDDLFGDDLIAVGVGVLFVRFFRFRDATMVCAITVVVMK